MKTEGIHKIKADFNDRAGVIIGGLAAVDGSVIRPVLNKKTKAHPGTDASL